MANPLLNHYKHLLGARDAAPDKTVIVLILDSAGRFVRWNHAAETLTGRMKTEMTGHVLWEELLFQEDIEPVKHQFERILSGWPSGTLEYRWKIHGGAARWMACSNFEPCVSTGGMQYLAFTATDVTESRHSRDWRASLFEEFIQARANERHEISRFIHDTVAQSLVALTLSLDRAQREPAAHDARLALHLVERCCRDVRLLTYMLAPPALGDGGGLVEGIKWHARTLKESGALDIDLCAETTAENLSPEVRAVLFAAVHEFTAQAITSRGSRRLTIVLKLDGPSFLLEMRGDFGRYGIGGRECPAIRERVGALGGRLEITPHSVRIALPTARAAAAA